MREFVIQENDANQRVDKFLQKTMPSLPKSLMYKYIRNKKIKVNRKRCEISQRLLLGDRVLCFIPEEFFETKVEKAFLQVSAKLDVLYEDANIVLMKKPSGLLTHKDRAEQQDNLAERFLHYLYKKGEYDPAQCQSFTPALCHRLDRNTEGLVIGAKSAEALRRMNAHIRAHEVEKCYVCIVEGTMEKKQDTLTLWHRKNASQNRVYLSAEKTAESQEIVTSYRVLHQGKRYAYVEVELHTGKSHQIRAVMAYLHHPLYGDVKYGAHPNARKDFQALCAYKISFHFDDDVLTAISSQSFTLKQNQIANLYQELEGYVWQ